MTELEASIAEVASILEELSVPLQKTLLAIVVGRAILPNAT
jgi:hypothetical protein